MMRVDPADLDTPPRLLRYPLKTARILRTDSEIAQARANIASCLSAKAIAEEIRRNADRWMVWDDADLLRLLAPSSVPRAFDLNASVGCPKCGKEIYRFGSYPWIVDPLKPFKLTCPVDGSTYPSNDYETYYRSGFKSKIGWDTEFVDDGWGWLSPNGERYWFVAHANHQLWKNSIAPGLSALAQGYLLTGDHRYAHKAAVMLYRIAQIYPAMDHEHQSRYGKMMAERGERYTGKILNRIWETFFAAGIAEAYDFIWETIDEDIALQMLVGTSGPEIRAFIEANFLEDAMDAYYSGRISGNYGMHQNALSTLALTRQYGDQDRWLGGLIDRVDDEIRYLGVKYALYNLIHPDGMPYEGAPQYNFLWVDHLTTVALLLRKWGRDLFAYPRMRALYDGVLDILNLGKFTPALGDSGSVYGKIEGRGADVYQTAYRIYRDERYAEFLASFDAAGVGGFKTFASLFSPALETSKPLDGTLPALPARLLDGSGVGILCNPGDTVSATLTYGLKAGHGHYDRLSFELFAADQPLMPDLGYPDAMNEFVSGIYTWSKNTVSHNTVVVDTSRQSGNVHGAVRLFVDSPFARILDVDAAGAYPQASVYRRALFMIDAGDAQSYYLDVFDVAGGEQHDYVLHGPPGEFRMLEGQWSEPAPGTLAGAEVAIGELYDDPARSRPGYDGGYSAYAGSGFQHLFHVRKHIKEDWIAEYRHEKDLSARLRLRILPQEGQITMMADASVSSVKFPQLLKYLIARRIGTDLTSRFVSVIEPYRDIPVITSVTRLQLDEGSGVALCVKRAGDLTDFLLYDPDRTSKRLQTPHGEIATDARAALVTVNGDGSITRVFFTAGEALSIGAKSYCGTPEISAQVVSVSLEENSVRLHPDTLSEHVDPQEMEGRSAFFCHGDRRTAHLITWADRDGSEWILTLKTDLRVGCIPVETIDAKRKSVKSRVPRPFAEMYKGAFLADSDGKAFHRIAQDHNGAVELDEALSEDSLIAPAGDAWIVNVGPGDRLELPSVTYSYNA